MAEQRKHTIVVTERELRDILSAFDIARDQTVSPSWRWWLTTKRPNNLYIRLREQGRATGE